PIVGIAREVSTDSSSKECLDLISAWIKDCERNHPACRRPDAQPLPTRVIKVGSRNSELKLYTSKNESSRYISLSHCWGGVKSMTLTKDNLNSMAARIPFASLPKTFSDAINITRRLGVPYLWIDSLCIIQDSAEDWEVEAAKMSDIYANAYLTIAADGAANSHGGCYVAGEDRDVKATEVKCTDVFGDKCRVYIRQNTAYPEQVHIPAHERTKVGLPSTLASRAWVLQERVLSPRTLHFTAKEVTWECETFIRCECSGLLEWGSPNSSSGSARTHLTVQNAFTQLDLTFSSDRLPAISGLAAAYAKSTRYTYLAGLWKEDLPSALLWEFDHHSISKRTSCRYEQYYAPTWSWASITGPVKCGWQPFDDVMDFEVVAADCVPAGKNPYGPVQNGFIEGIGMVATIRLEKRGRTGSTE
ncbi:HET-domain-containing protein, partial [Glonium stellatum]